MVGQRVKSSRGSDSVFYSVVVKIGPVNTVKD